MADLVKLRIFERNGQFLSSDEEFKLVPENIPFYSDLYPDSEDLKEALEELKIWIEENTQVPKKEIRVLASQDIINQYVDLNNQYLPDSLNIGVGQRVNLYEGLDYEVSIVANVTRLNFIGPSAITGDQALEVGQTLYVQGTLG